MSTCRSSQGWLDWRQFIEVSTTYQRSGWQWVNSCIWFSTGTVTLTAITGATLTTTHLKIGHMYMKSTDAQSHYIDVIMTTMASQITSRAIVYSSVYLDADQRKHQSSASLAFVWGIHRDRLIPRTKGQLRGKCFHLMTSSCFKWGAKTWLHNRVPG